MRHGAGLCPLRREDRHRQKAEERKALRARPAVCATALDYALSAGKTDIARK
ncbi:MAG: hypothetical protein OEZ28_01730 [Nitrospinota bacterium]|nr:hypothetical protein [Nitrospinota bacterium]